MNLGHRRRARAGAPIGPAGGLVALLLLAASGCGGGAPAPAPAQQGGGDQGGGAQGGGNPAGGGQGGNGGGAPGGDPAPPPGGSTGAAEDWAQFRHDVRGSSATGEALSTADAAALHVVWTQEIGEYGYGQPVRSGDTVYAATSVTGVVFALDAGTGAVLWRRDLRYTTSSCSGPDSPGIWGAVASDGAAVYVGAPDGDVHALDPATGADLWRAHVADPAPHAELIESSVAVARASGKLLVGVGSSSHCDPVQGRVAAIDVAGRTVQQQAMVGPDQLGGSVWSTPAVDEAAGAVFVATGNPIGDPAAEPTAQAVVALDATTLAPRDHWQNPAGLHNCDFGASPTLLDAGGRALLAAVSKDGWLYVLDRAHLAAGPIWKRQLALLDPAQPDQCGDPLKGFGSIVSPAFAHGLLYVAGGRTPDGQPGALVALDPLTGEVRFTHPTPGYVITAPAVAGDVVAVASNALDNLSSTLELLDASTGAVLQSFPGASGTFAAPAFSRGLLLWVTFEGHLTAFGR